MTTGPSSATTPSLRSGAAKHRRGYLCVSEDGGVFCFGDAVFHGAATDPSGLPVSAVAVHPDGDGYWVASRRGRIAAFGVVDLVGPEGVSSGCDIVDVVAAPDGRGIWALDAVGGVFCYGSADFHGSVPGLELDAPVQAVALTPTPDGKGYWILDRVGGVFCFGDAKFYGSVPELGSSAAPAVTLLAESTGEGYTVVVENGSCRAFGRADDLDPVTARHPIVGATKTPNGALLVDANGIVYPLGSAPFLGTPAAFPLGAPVVDVAWYVGPVSG